LGDEVRVEVDGEAGGSAMRTVLVVDDDSLLLSTYSRGFVRGGYRVLTASTSESGLELAKRDSPDLLIIDLRLGARSGIDLIRSIRCQDTAGIVCLISAYLSVAAAVSALRAGADHVFYKPISVSEILRYLFEGDTLTTEPETASLARATYEHMMRVIEDCDGNLSEAARRLKVHRQSLQRRLRKLPP
jgi:two-component system response regulator RegA